MISPDIVFVPPFDWIVDKLNFLASSLAPEYLDSLTSGYMAGNIAYITLGEYIYDQPGIITSLTLISLKNHLGK